jgi:cell division protein FtsX
VSENDYSVKKDNQTLQEKLEEINKLKENNMISEEEYYNLRKKIFDDYTK